MNTEKLEQFRFRHAAAMRYCLEKNINPHELARQLLEQWYLAAIKTQEINSDGVIE